MHASLGTFSAGDAQESLLCLRDLKDLVQNKQIPQADPEVIATSIASIRKRAHDELYADWMVDIS